MAHSRLLLFVFFGLFVSGNAITGEKSATTTVKIPGEVKKFLKGKPPVLNIESGQDQGDFSGMVLDRPFVVSLANQEGMPLVGAQVTFAIQSGGGRLRLVNKGITDEQGMAQAYLQLPSEIGSVITVKASFANAGVDFTASVGDPATAPAEPGTPESAREHGESTAIISWEDRSNNENGFIIECALDGRKENWRELARVPKNTTTYTASNLVIDRIYFYRISSFNDASP